MLALVTREQVWETVSSLLRREFGRLLEVRDVRRIRRVAGEGWNVTVVLTAASGDLHVADVTVDEGGSMTPVLDADAVVLAIRRAKTVSMMLAQTRNQNPTYSSSVDAFICKLHTVLTYLMCWSMGDSDIGC